MNWCEMGVVCFQNFNSLDPDYGLWQFMPSNSSSSIQSYALRNRARGANFQLGTYQQPAEIDPSKTQPQLEKGDASDKAQQWVFQQWPDDSYWRVNNVENGTSYNLDVHPGNPVFLSSDAQEYPR